MVLTKVPSLIEKLHIQIALLQKELSIHAQDWHAEAILLTGSCSRGDATYRSDIDVLMIIRSPALKFELVQKWRDLFDALPISHSPLPVEVQFVLTTVFETEEPAMKSALKNAILLWERADFNFEKRIA